MNIYKNVELNFQCILSQAEDNVGMAMVYTLVESMKDWLTEMKPDQCEQRIDSTNVRWSKLKNGKVGKWWKKKEKIESGKMWTRDRVIKPT